MFVNENKKWDYTCLRLAQIAIDNPLKFYGIDVLKKLYYVIFQNVYELTGEFRSIDIEKEEPAPGGKSIEYSNFTNIPYEIQVL